jgi:hypothetical protein
MIPAIAQAIANVLVAGTSLTSTEQIDFGHPGREVGETPRLTVYFYEIQEANFSHSDQPLLDSQHDPVAPNTRLRWFNVAFVLIAWEHTMLAEQRLLSETLTHLLRYQSIPAEFLPPALQNVGHLPMQVSTFSLSNTDAFWQVIGIPLRPALQLIVTTPFPLLSSPKAGEINTPVSHPV